MESLPCLVLGPEPAFTRAGLRVPRFLERRSSTVFSRACLWGPQADSDSQGSHKISISRFYSYSSFKGCLGGSLS